MNMADFTKGPWSIGSDIISIKIESECQDVAEINRPEDPRDISHATEVVANAHLIAAAPDMYEALKELVGIIDGYWEDNDREAIDGFTSQPAKAAIAKAEGQRIT